MTKDERTSLLPQKDVIVNGNKSDKSDNDCESPWKVLAWEELWQMSQLALPVIITYLLEFIPGMVSLLLVGHIPSSQEGRSKMYIDATAMAVCFSNMTGLSIGFGLSTAMDTLCPQAYGANRVKDMGVYFQTGVMVLGMAFVPVFVLNMYCGEVLVLLNQPRDVSLLAGEFARWMLVGMPPLYVYEMLKKVLQAQNIVQPMMWVALAANVINAGLGYYLVYHTGYGFIGAAIARSVSNFSFPLLLIPYLWKSGVVHTFWGGIQLSKSIRGIGEFVNLGVSGMFMLCFEWWAFEVIALVSGWLPDAVLAIGANAIILSISSTTFMIYLGISVSGNVRVGNALGSRAPRRAQVASLLTILLAIGMATAISFFLILYREEMPELFTHDRDICTLTTKLVQIAALFQIVDAVNAAVQGAFRASGRQSLGAKMNFMAYYVVGLPIGVWLAFYCGYGLRGLWIGMTVGLAASSTAGCTILWFTDWDRLVEEAEERVALNSPNGHKGPTVLPNYSIISEEGRRASFNAPCSPRVTMLLPNSAIVSVEDSEPDPDQLEVYAKWVKRKRNTNGCVVASETP